MMLQLPIWRYPAVVIFSLGLHGILLLIIFSEYRRNPPPSQIEWFDLKEMTLTPSEIPEKSQSASAISAVSKKQEMVPQEEGKTEFQTKTKELPTVIIPPAKTQNPEGKIETMIESAKTEANAFPNKEEQNILENVRTSLPVMIPDQELTERLLEPGSSPSQLEEITIPDISSKPVFSLDDVLQDTRSFRSQTDWDENSEEQKVSSSLGDLLTGIRMIRLSAKENKEQQNMRLDSLESEAYLQDLNHFFTQHWEVPLHLAESELTVVVRIRIDKEGRIQKSKIETSSGNAELDHSVSRLLKNLQSLPSLPYSYLGHIYEFGIKFTPRDLQF